MAWGGRDRVLPRSAVAARGTVGQERISNANAGRRCTQNTQMVLRGSQAIGHAFDPEARSAEIKQEAEPRAGRFAVIGALHPVEVVQRLDGLTPGVRAIRLGAICVFCVDRLPTFAL